MMGKIKEWFWNGPQNERTLPRTVIALWVWYEQWVIISIMFAAFLTVFYAATVTTPETTGIIGLFCGVIATKLIVHYGLGEP